MALMKTPQSEEQYPWAFEHAGWASEHDRELFKDRHSIRWINESLVPSGASVRGIYFPESGGSALLITFLYPVSEPESAEAIEVIISKEPEGNRILRNTGLKIYTGEYTNKVVRVEMWFEGLKQAELVLDRIKKRVHEEFKSDKYSEALQRSGRIVEALFPVVKARLPETLPEIQDATLEAEALA